MTNGLTDDILDWASRFTGLPLSREPGVAASGAVAMAALADGDDGDDGNGGGGAPSPASFTGDPSPSSDRDANREPSNQRQHHPVPTRVADAPRGTQQQI